VNTGNLIRALALLALATAVMPACSAKAPKQTELMKSYGIEDFTTRELTVVILGFGTHCAGTVELAAQVIQDGTTPRKYRKTQYCGS
jgi:hypothetical protein